MSSESREHPTIEALCARFGIDTRYHDVFGHEHQAPRATLRALLSAFGVAWRGEDDDTPAAVPPEAGAVLPAVHVVRAEQAPWSLALDPAVLPPSADGRHLWHLRDEYGEPSTGDARIEADGTLSFDVELQPGYHRLSIEGAEGETLLIATPGRCYRPPSLAPEGGGRAWGLAVQLPALRSRRNWGIGDFGDLSELAARMAPLGVDAIGLNPLHALFAHNPLHASPYSPSTRQQIDALYIAVEAVPDFAECEEARRMVAEPAFQTRLKALRAAPLVDRAGVAQAKHEVLRCLFAHFERAHLGPDTEPGSDRARIFRSFVADRGEALHRHALFEALQAHFHAADASVHGWTGWPETYRDPASEAVAQFERTHASELHFHQYLQWLASMQLAEAGARCRALGMRVGLYLDLAISVDRAGSDAWGGQSVFALGASVGAPPDEFNPQGQGWGLPPLRADRLRTSGYRLFADTLRANMRHGGALRIDHVMGLMRLFWIPEGSSPRDGAYVQYPLEEMLAILTLESHRHRCMVIGEDLGTVAPRVREALARADVLSYRVLVFETRGSEFLPPADYPGAALATFGTHDLATLAGWWSGHDLRLRAQLGLFPSQELFEKQQADRAAQRVGLLRALHRQGLLSAEQMAAAATATHPDAALTAAVHAYIGATPCTLAMVQPEDLLGTLDQANLPGTTDELQPNWRRKLEAELETLATRETVRAVAARLAAERPRASPTQDIGQHVPAARIPRATYRLQLHRDFGFDAAAAIVPYLARLGISHVYCSPIQRARAGSMHGYDVVAHDQINPELGGAEGFERFTRTLHAQGLGLLLDMVPNHMGVFGADNGWWMDVLEHGPASVYAQHFDIDWEPLNPELRGKVLLPVLGVPYGEALAEGALVLHFERGEGTARGEAGFALRYYEHRFPIAPRSHATVLARAAERLAEGPRARLQALAEAWAQWPVHDASADDAPAADPAVREARSREHALLKARLGELADAHAEVAQALAQATAGFNDGGARDALHALIEAQHWRLTYWRVAADEINYRRFFDINDLAALRMERDEVFEATQSLALDLAAQGIVDGLRIDHPDGLHDPARYFRQLQEGYARRAGLPLAGDDAQGRPARPLYVVAEKIVARGEEVPEDWHVHGTTGYRFANVANGVLIDTAAAGRFAVLWHRFTGSPAHFEAHVRDGKAAVMRHALASELSVLSNALLRIARADRDTRDHTLNTLRRALAAVVACLPVYRSYIVDVPSAQDRRFIDVAVAAAERHFGDGDTSVYEFLRQTLSGEAVPTAGPALRDRVRRFAVRFQQFSAPVAAKGVEDTAFYRYFPLAALNEVGGDPDVFGVDVEDFHAASADRADRWPHTMLATSTHDNKRSEDVRTRIDVLSEIPREWRAALMRWRRLQQPLRERMAAEGAPADAPSGADLYLLCQTLVGTLPAEGLEGEALADYSERIVQYMHKAAREAKLRTAWTRPDAGYEDALRRFVELTLDAAQPTAWWTDLRAFASRIALFGAWNSLSLTLLKFASPGVPDVYQGTELMPLTLVDPDNRRAVDYACREDLLEDFEQRAAGARSAESVGAFARAPHDGRAKLWFAWRLLALRRAQDAFFRDADYRGLRVEGPLARHVVAFERRHEGRTLVVVAARFFAGLCGGMADEAAPVLPVGEAWRGTRVWLSDEGTPDARVGFTELLTDAPFESGSELDLALLFARLPWAALWRGAPGD
jgi:(1->4)-alpha-D-glucan 1-alpha-D-glucosylmutase